MASDAARSPAASAIAVTLLRSSGAAISVRHRTDCCGNLRYPGKNAGEEL